jgi:Ca2+-binding EF-hand superfamily protein
VFYLHPFEISDNRCSDLTGLPKNERFYMSYGISSYAKRIERIIEMLKKEGYSFVTFEELCKIMTPKESVSI